MKALQVFGLSMLLTISLFAIFTGLIFFVMGQGYVSVGGAVFSIVSAIAAAGGLWGLIRLYPSYLAEYRSALEPTAENVIARWSVPTEMWRALADFDRRDSGRNSRIYAGMSFLLTAAVSACLAWWVLDPLFALMLGIAIGAVVGGGVWCVSRWLGVSSYLRLQGKDDEVLICHGGIVVRGVAINWSSFTAALERCEPSRPEGLEFTILTFQIRGLAGETTVTTDYRVPVPAEAERLLPGIVDEFGLNRA